MTWAWSSGYELGSAWEIVGKLGLWVGFAGVRDAVQDLRTSGAAAVVNVANELNDLYLKNSRLNRPTGFQAEGQEIRRQCLRLFDQVLPSLSSPTTGHPRLLFGVGLNLGRFKGAMTIPGPPDTTSPAYLKDLRVYLAPLNILARKPENPEINETEITSHGIANVKPYTTFTQVLDELESLRSKAVVGPSGLADQSKTRAFDLASELFLSLNSIL